MGMKIAGSAVAKGLPGVEYPAPAPGRLKEASALTRRPIRTKGRFGQQQVAFTLIELLVVVAIVSIVSALVIPFLLRRLGPKEDDVRVRPAERAAQVTPGEAPPPLVGVLPDLDRTELQIQLSVTHHRVGMAAYTRYTARHQGRLLARRPPDGSSAVRLEVPFPRATVEARDVFLHFSTPAGRQEPEGVTFGLDGIRWVGALPEDPTVVEVEFVTQGREVFEYNLPAARRARSVEVDLQIEGVSRFLVPDRSLQPTSDEGTRLRWQFRNLVAHRPIIVDLPGAQSPLGRAMRLFKLMGIAVLLFGAGFWHLSELRAPGALDSFRWGHFLLVALTYSTFFVVFSVLGFHGQVSIATSLAVAAAVSLPLLVLHVWRISSAAFALWYVLPLTVFTLALVVNGVYGGAFRDYVFVAAAVLATAFGTLTYPNWSAGRAAHAQQMETVHRQQEAVRRAEPSLETAERLLGALDGIEQGARQARARAEDVLASAEDPPSMSWEREHVGADMRVVDQLLAKRNQLSKRVKKLHKEYDPEQREELDAALREGRWLEQRLPEAVRSLRASVEGLAARRQEARPAPGEAAHCIACGHRVSATPYCPQCGTPQPRAMICPRCQQVLLLPVHLMAREANVRLHCVACGEPHPRTTAEGSV